MHCDSDKTMHIKSIFVIARLNAVNERIFYIGDEMNIKLMNVLHCIYVPGKLSHLLYSAFV
jgi:diphthamide biosynthesis methyltransferase